MLIHLRLVSSLQPAQAATVLRQRWPVFSDAAYTLRGVPTAQMSLRTQRLSPSEAKDMVRHHHL